MLLIIPTFLDITLLVFTITASIAGAARSSTACCYRRRSLKTESSPLQWQQGPGHSPMNRLEELKGVLRSRQAMLVAYWD